MSKAPPTKARNFARRLHQRKVIDPYWKENLKPWFYESKYRNSFRSKLHGYWTDAAPRDMTGAINFHLYTQALKNNEKPGQRQRLEIQPERAN